MFLRETEWKKAVKKALSREEAALLIEIYQTKTCIHRNWLEKERSKRRAEIEKVVEKALKAGLLYRVTLSISDAILFPVKKH